MQLYGSNPINKKYLCIAHRTCYRMDWEEEIEAMLSSGCADTAIQSLTRRIEQTGTPDDRHYYLLGNAYRKKGNWQMALNNYLQAIAINPQSPAAEAKTMLMDILDFYHKDLYNP